MDQRPQSAKVDGGISKKQNSVHNKISLPKALFIHRRPLKALLFLYALKKTYYLQRSLEISARSIDDLQRPFSTLFPTTVYVFRIFCINIIN